MNAFQIFSSSQIRTLALGLLSLGLASASPVHAAMTEAERCAWKADKVQPRCLKCLARSTTRLSNVFDGSTLDEDFRCAEQFHRSMDVLERRAGFKGVRPECTEHLTPESQAGTRLPRLQTTTASSEASARGLHLIRAVIMRRTPTASTCLKGTLLNPRVVLRPPCRVDMA